MTEKERRHRAIRDLIDRHHVASQEELRQLLSTVGWRVTQATLSRDLRELGIVRAPADEGVRYVPSDRLAGEGSLALEDVMPQWFARVDGVGELIVLHTRPGGAQPVSEALDAQGWSDMLGTIAGENTVLIICRSGAARTDLQARILAIAGAG